MVTDLSKDINDSKEAPEVVAKLQQLVNLKNVTMFITIHKAKTTGTARGHLGTEGDKQVNYNPCNNPP
ncbi:MAG: hypothetical protein IPG53_05080 [Ignavibacteriales bacterium]|nr:hypothetical protein [Ignavibacteriales bacterium]